MNTKQSFYHLHQNSNHHHQRDRSRNSNSYGNIITHSDRGQTIDYEQQNERQQPDYESSLNFYDNKYYDQFKLKQR